MTDVAELHAEALKATGSIVACIPAARWHPATASDGWDLAAATGQDTALDADLTRACQEVIEPQLEAFRGAGALAGPLPVPVGATAQTRLLAMLGRAG